MDAVHKVVKELELVNSSLEFDDCLKVSERRKLHKRLESLQNQYNEMVGLKLQPITKWDSKKSKFIEVGKSHLHATDCQCPQCIDSDLPVPYLRQR